MVRTGSIATFKHGVHPEDYKHLTNAKAIERMPFSKIYTVPLGQHIGAPSLPIVKKGDYVERGQMIAEAAGFVSVALHAPVSGKVNSIGLAETLTGKMVPSIILETDRFSSQRIKASKPKDYNAMSSNDFIASVQSSGLVGLGGAAFPAHVKFKIPLGRNCDFLIVNGVECEPFLTSDHRTMVEHYEEVIDGIEILAHHTRTRKVYIGIENNKPDAIELLRKASNSSELEIEVVALQVKYPQGAEKMLITAVLEKEIPSGKLPIDVDSLVSNVSSIAALSTWFRKGIPLMERVVTVSGTALKRPANVLVPIGTPMREVLDFCGGTTSDNVLMLLGGPMMGMVQRSLDVPVVKGTSGMLFLDADSLMDLSEYVCIKCGRCLDACPLSLNPSLLGLMARKGLWDEMGDHYVMDCFECGSCSFVCPSHIPLVQSFKVAKGILRERQAKKELESEL